MHKVRVRLCSFTARLTAFIHSSKQQHRRPQPEIPSNLYHRCSDLPLSIFITCSVDRDYSGLIRYGHATHEQLARAWEAIYSEYSTISGGQSYKLLINLSKDIGYLESKLLVVGLCLRVLQHRPDPKVIQILSNYGYKYHFDTGNPEQYAKNLDEIAKRSGGLQFAIQQKRAELDKSREKLNGKEVTREMFDKILAALSKHMGISIREIKQGTVTEFCAYRYNFEKEIEAMKKATDNGEVRESRSKSNIR